MPHLKDAALPAQGSTAWYSHYEALDAEIRSRSGALWQIDGFPGASDDAKFGAALSAASAVSGKKPILQFPGRYFGPLTTTRTPYSGMRLVGPDGNDGVKNLEIGGGNYVNHAVRVQTGTGTNSLFVQSSTLQDIVFANVAFSGSAGSQFWHNTNPNSFTIYPTLWHSLSFDGFNSVLGDAANQFTVTQGVFSGHWTVLNYQTTPLHLGGSDNSLWMAGYLNSNSPPSVAGGGKPILHLDWMEKTNVGYIYITAENGWSGVRVDAPQSRDVTFFGGTFEGRSPTNPATYPVVDVRGGRVVMRSPHFSNVSSSASGVVVQTGGTLTLVRPFYTKATAATASNPPLLYQTGGIADVVRPYCGDGNPVTIRWKDAALGQQVQDIPFPTANSVTPW